MNEEIRRSLVPQCSECQKPMAVYFEKCWLRGGKPSRKVTVYLCEKDNRYYDQWIYMNCPVDMTAEWVGQQEADFD